MPKHEYVYEGRNGRGTVDLYEGTKCIKMVFIAAKGTAQRFADALNEAYKLGVSDVQDEVEQTTVIRDMLLDKVHAGQDRQRRA